MMPFLPPLPVLWSAPLYGELYIGLCRALAGPWLYGVETRPRCDDPRPARVENSRWQLLDRVEGETIRATSLAELSRTVRGARDQNGISSSRSS